MIVEPYSTFNFFLVLTVMLVPAVILGLKEKRSLLYEFFFTALFLLIIFFDKEETALFFGACTLFFILVIKIFLKTLSIKKSTVHLWFFIIVILIPLVISRFESQWFVLGLSYMSFRVLQIIIESYNGLIKKISVSETLYFLIFIPALSAGPIDRSRRFTGDIQNSRTKDEYILLFKKGFFRMFMGIAYKFIFALLIYHFWLSHIAKKPDLFSSINYMYAYSLYLFFDFAGYSLIAVGVSNILSYDFPMNFNLPFISKDIKEFWNRWHLTLSFWLRDFLYTPFVMYLLKKKFFKSRYTASYTGYITTMTVMGLWHGFTLYYMLYGLYHGMLLVINDILEHKTTWYIKFRDTRKGTYILIFITFNLVCFGFLLFSGYNFT